jgi:hypothetical protein
VLFNAVKVFKGKTSNFTIKENAEFLQISQSGQALDVKLFNNNGQEEKFILEKAPGVVRIDKSRLTRGVYYVIISYAGTKQTYRFVR